MRRAARTDSNHTEIVSALRQAGCGVLDLSRVGNGCPDLLIHLPTCPWEQILVEVKDGRKAPSERKLTPDQKKFLGEWKGPAVVVTSVSDALDVLGLS